jgi:hypothetical protein
MVLSVRWPTDSGGESLPPKGLGNSSIPRQLPLAPMRVFAIGIEHPLDGAVQRSHDTDAREHRRAAGRRHQDQRLHRGLPFGCFVLGLRQCGDVVAGVLQGDELAAAGKRDRIIERPFPAALSHR